jgi:hypothetical protein
MQAIKNTSAQAKKRERRLSAQEAQQQQRQASCQAPLVRQCEYTKTVTGFQ